MADKKRIRLVVDAQLWQTSDRKRGMGLFLTGLMRHLDTKDTSIDAVTFVINSRLPDLAAEDKAIIDGIGGSILRTELLHRGDNEQFVDSAVENRRHIDKLLADNVKDVDGIAYFIPALFSSEIHPVFPSSGTSNILLFHDLIPFLYHREYFADHESAPRKDYAQRFHEFYRADTIVANSQTTADDLIIYLGVDPSRIVTIFGAAASRRHLNPRKPQGLDIGKGFVFMPSGDDFRKNNANAVQAFADLKSGLKLVLTSRFSEGTKQTLLALCPDIVFAGVVDDEEFLWLLDEAKVVLFSPLYEGLGMPLLEALERDAIVACSNISVFAEISETAPLFFDPLSVSDIANTLAHALKLDKGQYIKQHAADYTRAIEAFAWDKTAKAFVSAVDRQKAAGTRPSLAIFCPAPDSYSAVGKYALEVHAELSQYFEIDYYAENGVTVFEPTRPNILEYAADYYSASTFDAEAAKRYDYILYNLGNSEFHIDTILNALRIPANAIVHDTYLNGIFDWLERQGFITPARRQLEAKLDQLFDARQSNCLVSLVSNQRAVICHSGYAEQSIKQLLPGSAVNRSVHPIGVPAVQLKRSQKPTISFAGIISEDKGISMVASIAKNQHLQVKIFGYGVLGDSPLLQNVSSNVQLMKDLSDKEFQDLLRQTDILVNYRPNYHGETSRSTLEAMRYGAAVIVRDVGWFSELPDDTVVKVSKESDMVATIEQLVSDPDRLRRIGDAAREFLSKNYNYSNYARTLQQVMEKSK